MEIPELDKVWAALDDLGETPFRIAMNLEARGILGVRKVPVTCPIAVYLHDLFNVPVRVGVVVATIDDKDIKLSGVVSNFISQFDEGMYPWLEEEGRKE